MTIINNNTNTKIAEIISGGNITMEEALVTAGFVYINADDDSGWYLPDQIHEDHISGYPLDYDNLTLVA